MPRLPGFEWRPARIEDAEAIHGLLMAAEAVDQRGWMDSVAEIRQYFADPLTAAEIDSLLALDPAGQIAALGWVFPQPVGETLCTVWLFGDVHPRSRRRGLGQAILAWQAARGTQILATRPADRSRCLRAGCPETLADRVALFRAQGFEPIRSSYRMRRDLRQPIPAATLPDGLVFHPWSPELDLPMMEAFNESFQDHWGFVPVNEEIWRLWLSGHPNFRPDLTFLVLDGPGDAAPIAAFSFNEVRQPEIELSGIREGWIRDLGTRRPWRQRGLATALLCHSMHAFKAAGFDYAGLGVDTENLTGALRLYERLGFEVVRRTLTFSKTRLYR
jgi:ribosomal protein S18 acetylase RimI-like enzyme